MGREATILNYFRLSIVKKYNKTQVYVKNLTKKHKLKQPLY